MSTHTVGIDWRKMPDEGEAGNMKEVFRRILQQTTPKGFANTDRPLSFEIELPGWEPGRFWCLPPYMRIV